MSRKRRDTIDTLMTIAGFFGIGGICFVSRSVWMFTWICEGIAIVLALIAFIVKMGWREFIILPQALWMAIQDRRKRNGLRTMQNDNGRCYGCRYCRSKGV